MTTRPTFPDIDNGDEAWDADFNDVKDGLVEKPLPIYEHAGDESDIESTFPAASYGNCLVWVDHTVYGWTLYATDANGVWRPYQARNKQAVTSKTGAGSIAVHETLVICGGTPPYTLTLPTAASAAGLTFQIKNPTTGTVTVDGNGSETIDGAANVALATQYANLVIYSDGTTWHIL